jgi:hypothetical protein
MDLPCRVRESCSARVRGRQRGGLRGQQCARAVCQEAELGAADDVRRVRRNATFGVGCHRGKGPVVCRKGWGGGGKWVIGGSSRRSGSQRKNHLSDVVSLKPLISLTVTTPLLTEFSLNIKSSEHESGRNFKPAVTVAASAIATAWLSTVKRHSQKGSPTHGT